MIAVIGSPYHHRSAAGDIVAGGLAAEVARAAASHGSRVELIGRTGDDPAGDETLTALSHVGVGHAALLRDAARATPGIDDTGMISGTVPTLEPADVELALRYLTDFQVLVLAEPATPELVSGAVSAAGWSEATLIVLVSQGAGDVPSMPDSAIVLEAPPGPDRTEGLAAFVGALAARIDRGEAAGDAFTAVAAEVGATRAPA